MLVPDLSIQIKRLEKDFKEALREYNIVSFLNLASTLRVWTEMKEEADIFFKEKLFSVGIFTRKIKSVISGVEFTFSSFPENINIPFVKINNRKISIVHSGPKINSSCSIGSMFKIEEDRSLTISKFLISYKAIDDADYLILRNQLENQSNSKFNFSGYLASPIIHFQFPGCNPKNISCENLIKRVANEYGASHFRKDSRINNIFSEPVERLMKFSCMELPLPYFSLLYIAKTILSRA